MKTTKAVKEDRSGSDSDKQKRELKTERSDVKISGITCRKPTRKESMYTMITNTFQKKKLSRKKSTEKKRKEREKADKKKEKIQARKRPSKKIDLEVTAKPIRRKKSRTSQVRKKHSSQSDTDASDKEKADKKKPVTPPEFTRFVLNIKPETPQYDPKKIEESTRKFVDKIYPAAKVPDGLQDKLDDEFDVIEENEVDDNDCRAFLENMERNQAEEIECLDANRVVLDRIGNNPNTYIHASVMDIPNIPRKVILTQFPVSATASYMEDFWRLVYQEKVKSIFVLATDADLQDERKKPYFIRETEKFETIGDFWINNRRNDPSPDKRGNEINHLEILPVDSCEAVMSTMTLCMDWPDSASGKKPSTFQATETAALSAFAQNETDTVIIMSKNGSGRAGTFLAIATILHYVNNAIDFNIKDVVYRIRKQRPGAVDNQVQYGYIYSLVLQYMKKNTKDEALKQKIDKIIAEVRAETSRE